MTRYQIDIWTGAKWKIFRFCNSPFINDNKIVFFHDGESKSESFISVTIKLERGE